MPGGERSSLSERRRSSTWRSSRLLEDDDYDLIAHMVSDGFRPATAHNIRGEGQSMPSFPLHTPDGLSQLSRAPPIAAADSLKGVEEPSRLSVAKPPRLYDSLVLRNDGSESSRNAAQSSSRSSQDDDLHGSLTQPSHPYQLYPQRTHSDATSSTEPLNSEGTYDGPRAPTHPYAMYTQTTATSEDSTQPTIPVGFSSVGDNYSRQLGPEGEEAGDLIGPLGHMEELPPYSRYPQDTYGSKPIQNAHTGALSTGSNTETAAATSSGSSAPRAQPISGAGGIGLATRNPEFSSTEEDLPSAPERSRSLRSVATNESVHDINGAARDVAEKPSQNKWQRRAKKKLWGIVPYWVICLTLSAIIVLGIVMGTVIGTIVTKQRRPPPPQDSLRFDKKRPSTGNIQYLPSPPQDLTPLIVGSWALPSMVVYDQKNSCIADTKLRTAWSCDVPSPWFLMNVSRVPTPDETCNFEMTLSPNPITPKELNFPWGSQPPLIVSPQRLALVTDLQDRSRGPAWFFEMEYNKTVILGEDQIIPSSGSPSKRDDDQKGVAAKEGDKPWICTWPNVKLQVFIYANQKDPGQTASATSPAPTSSSSPSPGKPYPRLIKFIDRHDPTNISSATCTKYKIADDEEHREVYMKDGKPVTVGIDEVSKTPKTTISKRRMTSSWPETRPLERRDTDIIPCACVSYSWRL